MPKVLIIGAGGVGTVGAHKCAQLSNVFTDVAIASRTKSKCDHIAASVKQKTGRDVETYELDADDVPQTIALIEKTKPDVVLNLALPFQDLSIMDACLATKVDYLDTACYEPRDESHFEYSWQWVYQDRYADAGIMALLGCGFDPGAINVFCAYAAKHLFDEIHTIDLVDCNAGNHGKHFATNFNTEVNIREITQDARYWDRGKWITIAPLSRHVQFDYPNIGARASYLMYHEELESLVKFLSPVGLQRIRFWMTFSPSYLTHLRVLVNVGMTRIDEVDYAGRRIVPLQFLQAVLPEPAGLGKGYEGITCIGAVIQGVKDGRRACKMIYNNCDHAKAFDETGAQAVSYTTGVPAMLGAKLMLQNTWRRPGVFNVEQLDPDPFLADMTKHGLPWHIVDWSQPIDDTAIVDHGPMGGDV